MSGVTPESTTAALAAGVPKEAGKASESETTNGSTALGAATISSAAPDSTTAELAKDVPVETKNGEGLPGAFPATPAQEAEPLSVNPLPATAGAGNPIHLKPGEKVPDPSTFTNNTLGSTAKTDQASYEQDASAAGFATGFATAGEENTEGSGGSYPADNSNPTIQSAAPVATTAALAAGVPLEPRGKAATTENGSAADDVPGVVKDSLAKAHKEPEAATSGEAVGEKKEVEHELLQEVPPDHSAGASAPTAIPGTNDTPAADVPGVVAQSHADGGAPLEAATSREAVAEKKDVEEELLKKVPTEEAAGEPAPTDTAATTETAPVAPTTTATDQKKPVSRDVSPMTKDANASNRAAAPEEPTVTTGPTETQAPKTSGPKSSAPAAAAAPAEPAKSPAAEDSAAKKKKNRASGFFSKLKEKFK